MTSTCTSLRAIGAAAQVGEPAALVELAPGGVEQRVPNAAGTAPPSTTTRGRTRRPPAIARPIITPVRSTIDAGARRSGRFVSSSIADDDTYAVRQPGRRTGTAPVGLDDDVAELAGVAVAAAQQPPVADDARLDGVGHEEHHHVVDVGPSTDPALGEHAAPCPAVPTTVGSPVRSRDPLPQLEAPARPAGAAA